MAIQPFSINNLTRAEIEQLLARAEQAAQGKPPEFVRMPGGTSALLALVMIWKEKRTLDGLRVALLGNLKSDTTAQTLARLLGRFDVRLSFVSPAALSMPYDVSDELRTGGIEVEETNDLTTTVKKCDVLYLARLDPAVVEPKVYARFKDYYALNPSLLDQARPGLLVLGAWDGADALLAPARVRMAECEQAVMAALGGE